MILKYTYTPLLIKSAGNISIGRMAAITEGRAVAQDAEDPSASQTYSDKSLFHRAVRKVAVVVVIYTVGKCVLEGFSWKRCRCSDTALMRHCRCICNDTEKAGSNGKKISLKVVEIFSGLCTKRKDEKANAAAYSSTSVGGSQLWESRSLHMRAWTGKKVNRY